ncbi:cysteine desulfurase IscS [Sporomusaceae bacterium FL31]|nr:cysteine desulfurase IscS [Sporomusaceae bacterium FL31]GCE35043.1 cysteine desulfurase IscS [Sporomusaceae bacterium]
MKLIYFDHAATSPVHMEVAEIIKQYLTTCYGNPSSIYRLGYEAREAVDDARTKVASLIGASPNEIIFTSGGTEADNLAISGIAFANQHKGNHIITSSIEHHAVMHTCSFLETQGFHVTYLPVDKYGMVRIDDLKQVITDKTILISIMFANNEVGTIQPIKDIGAIAKERNIYFHTDAVGAIGSYPIDVNTYAIDLLTLSGHKIHAPKGIGALYIRNGVKIQPIQHGGAHERAMRAGTENVPGIVGLGKACELAQRDMNKKITHLSYLRDKLIREITANISDVKLNGHPTNRTPGNANFSFSFIEGESLLLNLDLKGIAASSGSACSSGALNPSHVLLAMGLSHETAHGSLRITLGIDNTEAEIDYFVKVAKDIVYKLRSMSPLYNQSSSNT